MTNFQIGLLVVFGIAAGVAVLVFSNIISIGGKSKTLTGEVVIWGTLSETAFQDAVSQFNDDFRDVKVTYVEKNEATFTSEFVAALASRKGPDMVITPENLIFENQDKFIPIPLTSYPERTFKDTFVQEGELFLAPEGILALPIAINPMVMYWNRDILQSKGYVKAPTTWEDLTTFAQNVSKKDDKGNITTAAVALGDLTNVRYAKNILALLLLGANEDIISRSATGNGKDTPIASVYSPAISTDNDRGYAKSALEYFTQFSNPVSTAYSWNRALPNSRDMFTNEALAIYFGYPSEIDLISQKNPHLNFDVAPMPQIKNTQKRATIGTVYGAAIVVGGTRVPLAFYLSQYLSANKFSSTFVPKIGMVSARRDIVSQKQSDASRATFYDAALIARGWFDVNTKATTKVFKDMVDGLVSGRYSSTEAVNLGQVELGKVLNPQSI